MLLQPSAVASCPEIGTIPASFCAFSAVSAPSAVPSFDATTASILFCCAVSTFSMIFSAFAASQLSTHWSATTLIRPWSMYGFSTSSCPCRTRIALLSVGLPPISISLTGLSFVHLPLSICSALTTPSAWFRPTSVLLKEM